jgi:capsular exopolysaccharide synthesis family protein
MDRDGGGGSSLWAPHDPNRQLLQRVQPGAVAAWEDHQFYEPQPEINQGARLLEYWRIIYKHLWVIVIAVVVALAIGIAVTMLTKRVYTAATTIEIDRETTNVVGIADGQPVDRLARDEEFFQTQYGLLKSWSLSARVAQSLNLASDPNFLRAMGVDPATARPQDAARRQQWATGVLQGGLGVLPVRDSRLVRLTFDSPDPGLSARVANAFADNFISSNLERKFEASAYARTFLEQRLAELKAKLEDSERQLVAYATQQQIIQVAEPSSKDAAPPQSLNATNLAELDTALTAAKANLVQAQERYRATQAAPGLAAPEILADPTVEQLREDRAKLATQYQQQLKLYKPDYPDMLQLKAQIDDIDHQLTGAADTIRRSLKTQYDTAAMQVGTLQGQVNQLKGSVLDERNREIQYNILQREVDTTRTLYDGLLQRYKEIGIAGGITSNNISIVDRARPPGGPSKPQPMRNLTLAGGAGLAIGIALAFLLETLDQAIRKPADVESKLGIPVLGSVPLLEKGVLPMEALQDTRSPFSEAYHSIRSTLAFSTKDGAPRVLAVTSARPEEGKSTTSFALAHGFARLGMRVLLIDLDLRNPSLHRTIGAENRIGASNILTGAARLQNAVQPTDWPNFFVLTSGPLPPSPAELLTGPRLVGLVKDAAEHFDIVILDGPPVMGLADAPLIASVANGALLTIEAGRTSRAQAQAALKRLRVANARMLGAVLTKFDAKKTSYGYGYAYAYEYDYQYGRKQTESLTGSRPTALSQDRSRKPPPAA